MALKVEIIKNPWGDEFKKTTSDNKKFIRKIGTNAFYSEAIDTLDTDTESLYKETDEDIIEEETEE